MPQLKKDLTFLDDEMIVQRVFYPRKHHGSPPRENKNTFSLKFKISSNIQIIGRFYLSENSKFSPTILFFHGNGAIASDYDFIGPSYQQLGINFFVADYRGYGNSNGSPTFSTMISDSHVIYQQFREYLLKNGFIGSVSVMGRSLGSASAIELASQYQDQIACLIIESGFAHTFDLLRRLGVPSSLLPVDREEEASALPLVKKIKIPFLLIHGENDIIIPLSDGISLYNTIASETKEILIIPQAGHNDLLLMGPEDYMEAIREIIFQSSK
ncbi:MAG: alpha/beta hydrolase [Candidatus Hodarchaeota archaeon]